jgi:hypothetical protein
MAELEADSNIDQSIEWIEEVKAVIRQKTQN